MGEIKIWKKVVHGQGLEMFWLCSDDLPPETENGRRWVGGGWRVGELAHSCNLEDFHFHIFIPEGKRGGTRCSVPLSSKHWGRC